MQILSARHVKTEESLRLGVVSGWYSTKVSGTFVTGPHIMLFGPPSKMLGYTEAQDPAKVQPAALKPDLCCHRHRDPPAALSALATIFADGPKRGIDSIR